MNILVIDGFNSNSEGRKRFKAFHDAVVGGFETHWVHGLTVQVKRYDDLAEFVPSSGDNFIRVAPMKQFDKLDFVFVDGDLPLRPWSAQAQSVFKIMAMGVQTGKCIWASSFATPLVLCAINTHGTRDNIPPLVSAYPEGGTLDELRCLPPPTAPGQRTKEGRELPDELDSIFLDKKSGDCFDADFAGGKYKGYKFAFNCGLKRREKHPDHPRELHRFSLPMARHVSTDAQLAAPAPYEQLVSVCRAHTRHWLFEDVDTTQPLLIRAASYKWSVAANPKSLDVVTLVDGAEGSEIIEYGHMVLTAFATWANAERYPAIRKLLGNYIKVKSSLIQTMEKLDFRSQLVERLGEGSAQHVLNRPSLRRPVSASSAASTWAAGHAPRRTGPASRPVSGHSMHSAHSGATWGGGGAGAILEDEDLMIQDDDAVSELGGAPRVSDVGPPQRHADMAGARGGQGLWLNLDGLGPLGNGVRQAVEQAQTQRRLLYGRTPSSARRRPALRPHTAGERRSRNVMDAMDEHGDRHERPVAASEPATARTIITTTTTVTRIPTRPSTALTRPSTAKTGASELSASGSGLARAPSIWDGGAKGGRGTSATLKDRLHQHVLAHHAPSRDTSKLLSGLVDGHAHALKSTARLSAKISHATTWHEIPSSHTARTILHHVRQACGAGLAGRRERSEIDSMIKMRLEDDAKAGMRERVNAELHQCNDSDSDDEGDEAPVLPGEDARHVFKPPPRNRHTSSPTPVPLHHLSHPRVFSARNASSGGGAWCQDISLGAVKTSKMLTGGAAAAGSRSKLLRPYSAPVRA